MANDQEIGKLRVKLTADTADFEAGARRGKQKLDELVLGMAAAGKEASASGKLIAGMGQSGKEAADKIAALTKPLDAVAAGMNEAGKAATANGKLIAGMSASGRQAQESLDKLAAAQANASKSSGILTSTFAKLTAAFSAASLIDRGVSGILALGSQALASAGHIVDLADKTGLTTDTIQRMMHVADQTGSSVEAFSQSAYKLGINISGGKGSTRQALDDLGLSWAKVKDLDMDKQWDAVTAALGRMNDAGERNRLGAELMGKGFSEISTAIAEGYDSIAREANVAGDAQVRAAEAAGDAWDKFKRDLGASATQALGNIALKLQAKQQQEQMDALLAGVLKPGPNAGFSTATGRDTVLGGSGSASPSNLTADLAAARKELAALTAEQRKNIEAGVDLGKSVDDISKSVGVSEAAVDLYKTALTKSREETKRLTDEHKKLVEAFTGKELFKDAKNVMDALYESGGVWTLTNEELEKTSKTLDALIDKYHKLGMSVPADMFQAANDARRILASMGKDLLPTKNTEALRNAADLSTAYLSGNSTPGSIALNNKQDLQKTLMLGFRDVAGMYGATPKEMHQGGVGASGAFQSYIGSNLMGTVMSAFQGGGSLGKSLGGLFGGGAASSLMGSGIGKSLSSGLTSMFGSTIGSSIGSLIPGLGAIAGPLLGKAFGALGGLFSGGEGHKTNQARDKGVTGFTGIADLGKAQEQFKKMAAEAGVTDLALRQLFDTKKTKDFEKSFADVTAQIQSQQAIVEKYNLNWTNFTGTKRAEEFDKALKGVTDDTAALERAGLSHEEAIKKTADAYIELAKQGVAAGEGIEPALAPVLKQLADMGLLTDDVVEALNGVASDGLPTWQDMEKAAEKYGLKLDEMGGRYAQLKTTDAAKTLLSDFDMLAKGGVPVVALLGEMSDEVNDFVRQAIAMGTELPADMKPMLEKFVDAGLLTEENGTKLEDLSKVKFAEPLETAIQGLIDKMSELIDKIGGVGSAFGRLPDALPSFTPPAMYDNGAIPMAGGGSGRAVGPTLFYSAGNEDFAFSGEGKRFGGGGSDPALHQTLRQIQRGQRDLPRQLGLALRDAMAGV